MNYLEFIPKSYSYLRNNYSWQKFKKDLIAGITVGIIALPLAMAFGIASGVSPERGLFTAIIAGFLISALGGSRVQIGGPTGAFVVIVYDIVQRNGYEGLAISTLFAAILLMILGFGKIGSWIKYVPHPLIVGFTTGIAILIFSSQIKDFFGLELAVVPAHFIEKWSAYLRVFPTFHGPTLAFAAGTLGGMIALRRYVPKVPWGVSAIVLGTLASFLFDLPLQTIATRFGDLPRSLPVPGLPSFSIPSGKLTEYLLDGMAIACLGAIESLLSAVIADRMIGGRHKSNCELVGQGIANFASVLFGGIPATGAIARTVANVKTGAQTPLAGMIHAIVLFLILFFFSSLVSQIPLASLAAVLIMVAWNMSELPHFVRLLKASSGDLAILLTAFLLTVFVDITVAILLGMILSSLIFMKRMAEYSTIDSKVIEKKEIPRGVEVYEMNGPFFFGAADRLQDLLLNREMPKIFILRLGSVPFIDASGMHALREFIQRCHQSHTQVFLSEVCKHVELDLKKFGLSALIGEEQWVAHIDEALDQARAQPDFDKKTRES